MQVSQVNLFELCKTWLLQQRSHIKCTLLKKFKGAHTLWQIAVKTDIPNFTAVLISMH